MNYNNNYKTIDNKNRLNLDNPPKSFITQKANESKEQNNKKFNTIENKNSFNIERPSKFKIFANSTNRGQRT